MCTVADFYVADLVMNSRQNFISSFREHTNTVVKESKAQAKTRSRVTAVLI